MPTSGSTIWDVILGILALFVTSGVAIGIRVAINRVRRQKQSASGARARQHQSDGNTSATSNGSGVAIGSVVGDLHLYPPTHPTQEAHPVELKGMAEWILVLLSANSGARITRCGYGGWLVAPSSGEKIMYADAPSIGAAFLDAIESLVASDMVVESNNQLQTTAKGRARAKDLMNESKTLNESPESARIAYEAAHGWISFVGPEITGDHWLRRSRLCGDQPLRSHEAFLNSIAAVKVHVAAGILAEHSTNVFSATDHGYSVAARTRA